MLFDFLLGGTKFNEINSLIQEFQKRIEASFIKWFVYFPLKNFKYNFDFELKPYKIVRNPALTGPAAVGLADVSTDFTGPVGAG